MDMLKKLSLNSQLVLLGSILVRDRLVLELAVGRHLLGT